MLLFYDHLIDKTEIYLYIDNLDAPEDKKKSFKQTIDDIIHTGIVQFILEKLQPNKHRNFLNQLQQAPYDPELLTYLKNHIDDKIEEEIQKQADRLIRLIKKDFQTEK